MSVADYNTDPNSNTSISGINIAEGCPPSGINNAIRQMMADIKDKADSTDTAITTLDANVVKLSGNQTVGGTKTFTDTIITQSTAGIRKSDATQFLQFGFTTVLNGGRLNLFGKDYDSADEKGGFALQTGNGSSAYAFKGLPNGALTWDGKGIITDGGDQNIGGTKTFSSDIVTSATTGLRRADNSGELWVTGGRSTNAAHGARIGLYGADYATTTSRGQFVVHAGNASVYKQLIGKPNGTFTWNGQNIQVGSDERIKTAIGDFPDDVLDAWSAVRWEQFKYREDAEQKGVENCRFHAGLVTQHVQQAMQAQGVDPLRYGILCHEEWQDETDEEGNIIREAGDLWMVRYTEALCMEAAYQRRRADRAEARITALEQRLDELEAAIATLGA